MVELVEFAIPRRRMTSGQGSAVGVTCRMIVGESGRAWLIPDPEVPDMAGRIHVTDSKNWEKRGDGFSGATLEIPLKDGGTFALRGGWHTNAGALFEDTGVDLRDSHATFVVLSRGVEYNQTIKDEYGEYNGNVMKDVVYRDPEDGLEGRYHRGYHIAVALAQKTGEKFFLYSESGGGSIFQRVSPDSIVRDPEDMS
jgi:hypothetical protein